jgi:hypothetical protein
LRYRQHRPAHVGERPLHLAGLLEDAEGRDLRGEPFAILGPVVRADSDEDDEPGFDIGYPFVANADARRPDALNDRAR